MRILILSDFAPPTSPGGASRVAFTQAKALQTLGHEVLLLTTRQDKSLFEQDIVEGVQVRRLRIDYPQRWRAYLSLWNPRINSAIEAVLDAFQPDLVHAHNVHTYLTYHSFALVKQRDIRLVLTCHDMMPVAYGKVDEFIDPSCLLILSEFDYQVDTWAQLRKHRLRYFPLRNAIIGSTIKEYVDLLVTPSQALMDALQANKISAAKMVVVPNGIDHRAFDVSDEHIKAFLEKQGLHGRKILLFPGRINVAKGANQVLKALPQITEVVPEALLVILSKPGGYGEQMTFFAEKVGLRQYTYFAGWLNGEELAASFRAANICLVPSIYLDPFPTVNLEALSVGTPVVGTCFGGTPEAVDDGETGFIVNPHNVSALAEACVTLLTNAQRRSEMSQVAVQRARARFDWLTQTQKLVDLYEQITI